MNQSIHQEQSGFSDFENPDMPIADTHSFRGIYFWNYRTVHNYWYFYSRCRMVPLPVFNTFLGHVPDNCSGHNRGPGLPDHLSYNLSGGEALFKKKRWYKKAKNDLRTKGKASIGGFVVTSGGSGGSWSSGSSGSGGGFSGGGGSSGGGGASGVVSWKSRKA